MAFPDVHVTCSYAGAGRGDSDKQAILNGINWSEAPAAGIVSTNKAPNFAGSSRLKDTGQPVFHILASIDAYIDIGPNPNSAVASHRFPLKAGNEYDIYVTPGDKFMWSGT